MVESPYFHKNFCHVHNCFFFSGFGGFGWLDAAYMGTPLAYPQNWIPCFGRPSRPTILWLTHYYGYDVYANFTGLVRG